MGLFGLGAPELVVIAGVTALLFGPSKIAQSLPGLGRGLGQTVKSVKAAAEEFKDEMNAAATEEEEKAQSDEKPKAASTPPPKPTTSDAAPSKPADSQ
ncbi:hypothetical protein CYMTET_2966 [Cymbomonas tetramitiformis]|uniref:Sec-independent protein translocase protein TatA n=1 Tax=Cymbomonas tetramitiformis TaxID=36881 RepID=A0AAE0LLH0_9CHLO|nr:hypothetical protein CYMTET_2966 [Cymbomonas tetramitiformis]|eukprot:gene10642-12587_t